MSYTGGISVIFALLVVGLNLTLCSALSIAITPDLYTEQSTGFANISCRIDAGDNDVKTIFMLEVLKGEQEPLVYLQAAGLSYGASVTDRLKFQAEGLIDTADVTKSFLKLAILEPSKQDGGEFSCKLVYADDKGRPKEHYSSANLTVEKLNLNDVVRQLLDQLASVQRQLDTQTDAVAKLTDANRALTQKMADKGTVADVVDRVSSLEAKAWIQSEELSNRVTRLNAMTWNLSQGLSQEFDRRLTNLTNKYTMARVEDRVSSLEAKAWIQSEELANRVTRLDVMTWNLSQGLTDWTNKSQELSQRLTDLTDRVTFSVEFSAALSQNVDLNGGQTLVFDNVLRNEGRAYDGSSGIFTTPRNGVYAFYVTLQTRCSSGCILEVHVKADGATMATLFAHDYYYEDQTSTSFVVHLNKGAKVKVETYGTTKLFGSDTHRFCKFSGYMERAD